MINWKDPEINLHLKEFISNGDYKGYYNIIINDFRVTDDEIIELRNQVQSDFRKVAEK
jgi:hypothetical protein